MSMKIPGRLIALAALILISTSAAHPAAPRLRDFARPGSPVAASRVISAELVVEANDDAPQAAPAAQTTRGFTVSAADTAPERTDFLSFALLVHKAWSLFLVSKFLFILAAGGLLGLRYLIRRRT